MQPGLFYWPDRVACLVVDADHLLRVSILSPPDVSLLEGCRPITEGDDQSIVDLVFGQHRPHQRCFAVVPDPSDEPHLRPESTHHGCDIGRATVPVLAVIGSQEGHGSFLADPFGVPPDVAIQDQVANHHDARTAQFLDPPNQIMRHVDCLLAWCR
jgi:hypothetical protein